MSTDGFEVGAVRPPAGLDDWARARIRKATRSGRGSNEFVRASRLPGNVLIRPLRDGRTVAMFVPEAPLQRNAIMVCVGHEFSLGDGAVRLRPADSDWLLDVFADRWESNGRTRRGTGHVSVAAVGQWGDDDE